MHYLYQPVPIWLIRLKFAVAVVVLYSSRLYVFIYKYHSFSKVRLGVFETPHGFPTPHPKCGRYTSSRTDALFLNVKFFYPFTYCSITNAKISTCFAFVEIKFFKFFNKFINTRVFS